MGSSRPAAAGRGDGSIISSDRFGVYPVLGSGREELEGRFHSLRRENRVSVETVITYPLNVAPSRRDGRALIDWVGPRSAGVLASTTPGPPWGFIKQLYADPTADLAASVPVWKSFRTGADVEGEIQRTEDLRLAGQPLVSVFLRVSRWEESFGRAATHDWQIMGTAPTTVELVWGEMEQFRDPMDGTLQHFGRFPFCVNLYGYGSPIDPAAWEAWYFNLIPVRDLEERLRAIDPGFVRFWRVNS